MQVRVAIVSRDPENRHAAARAFDSAPVEWTVRLFEDVPPGADVVVACPDVDIPGVRFDPHHPDVVDRVAEALSSRTLGKSVVIGGVSGGVGTTTLALHLSAALAARGPTVYLELDPNRCARHRLDLGPDTPTWSDVTEGDDSLLKAAVPVEGSFRVLLMPGEPPDGLVPTLLERCRGRFDYVVVDAGAGLDRMTLGDASLLVLTPSVVAATRARDFIESNDSSDPIVITNRLGPGSEMTRSMLEHRLGCQIAMELPCAPALRDREDEGRLLRSPWSRWVRKVDHLARLMSS